MKNKRIVSLLLLTLVLVLAACGGAAATPTQAPAAEATEAPAEEPMEEATEVPAEEPMEEATEAPAPDAEGSILIWADEARASVLEPIVEAFESEYGVPVEIQQLQFGDIRDQLKLVPEGI